MVSENDNNLPPTPGEDKALPKMRKRRMHREIEAVAGDREVAMVLEEHPGMVRLEVRLERGLVGSDQLGVFFLFAICALRLM